MDKKKPILKWKKPTWRRQETHCGKYFVDQSENGFWNSYRTDDDFPFTDRVTTRWEAKELCEEDAVHEAKKTQEGG